MHVLLVTYEFPPAMATGGIGSYMYQMACLLSRLGHRVSVISATNDEVDRVVSSDFGTNFIVKAAGHEEFRKKALLIFEQYFDIDEIDLMESPEVGACAFEIKRKFPQLPLLVKLHTPGVLITKISSTYQPVWRKLRYVVGALLRGRIDLGYWSRHDRNKGEDPEYLICQLADKILSPSEALRKWIVGYWQIPAEKISILRNPFTADNGLFQFPVPRNTHQICFIGKLSVLKGMFSLAPAFREVLHRHRNYTAIIVGRDEAVSENIPSMQQWMMRHLDGVEDRVRFTGPLPPEEVKQVLGESEALIVPSLWENYPTVVLEGMAAGCAVAASSRGGIPEIVSDGENGVLFDPQSVRSMVEAMELLLGDSSFRSRIAERGRKFLQTMNNAEFIRETAEIYLAVANGRKGQ